MVKTVSYLNAFSLTKEPFSNTPDPEFFYPARLHRKCLQHLEIAIRLGRGLNVILGDVGAGKTTLCRQLLRTLAADDNIDTYLMLDPGFEDLFEFLANTARLFGCAPGEGKAGVWDMKEAIKSFLFEKGVNEGRRVVLIIDEGQKLTEVNLEALREFLNYETNDRKLMQIVIFAQREFEATMAKHPNFTDRINLLHILGPLNFRETRAMIDYRLDQAGWEAGAASMFTRPALWSLYRASGGFPRKIINISHICVLNSLINNQPRVTRATVRNCHKMSASANFRKHRVLWPVSVMVFLIGILASFGLLTFFDTLVSLETGLNDNIESSRLTIGSAGPVDFETVVQAPIKNTAAAASHESGLAEALPQAAPDIKTGPGPDQPVEHVEPGPVALETVVLPPVNPPPLLKPVVKTANPPAPKEKKENRKNYISGASGTILFDAEPSEPVVKPPEPPTEDRKKDQEKGREIQPNKEPVVMAAVSDEADLDTAVADGPAPHLGALKIRLGDNVYNIITKVYGDFRYRHVKLFLKYNPEISDTNLVKMGQTLLFPVFPLSTEMPSDNQWIIFLGRTGSFDEAYQIAYQADSIPTRIVLASDAADSAQYEVIVNQFFKNRDNAARFLAELKVPETSQATIRVAGGNGPR